MRIPRQKLHRAAVLAAVVLALAGLAGAVGADAAGTYSAHAARPSYDEASLQLIGKGNYKTARRHSQLRVTVCLDHRVGARFFQVRCATGTGAGKHVVATVGVPGCVGGNWRTTATGEALNRKGAWINQASATGRAFHC